MPNQEEIIKRLIANTAEIITEDEFKDRLSSGDQLTHYIGFEISGYVHIGQGIMSALVMKDLTDLGVKCTVWLADWHTWINGKLDGTKETAAKIGEGYFTEAVKACFTAVGGNPDDLDFKLASATYQHDPMRYWELVITDMHHTTQARLARSVTIMGRQAGTELEGAKLVYPAMQAADVFFLEADIAHAGLDQRKAYVNARDVSGHLAPGKPKPIILLHELLPGLTSADGKMSKSDPASAIFVHDSEEEITSKIHKAFAPEKQTENNPVLSWVHHLLFWNRSDSFVIERKEEHGGNSEFNSYQDLEQAYASGGVHPMDLKSAVAREITELLAPVREHYKQPEVAAKKVELDTILVE